MWEQQLALGPMAAECEWFIGLSTIECTKQTNKICTKPKKW